MNRTPGAIDAMHCDTARGGNCDSHAAGHAMLSLQERVTAATPSKWRDGIVRAVLADGWIGINVFEPTQTRRGISEPDATVWVWHHGGNTDLVQAGEPVALHGLYHVLAIGRARLNVLVGAAVI